MRLWPREKQRAPASAAVVAADALYSMVPLLGGAPAVAPQYRALADKKDGVVGMVGYAPKVAVTQHRWLCEFCLEPVKAGVRHICWGNIEHHMASATPEEKARALAQLQALEGRVAQAIRRAHRRAKIAK